MEVPGAAVAVDHGAVEGVAGGEAAAVKVGDHAPYGLSPSESEISWATELLCEHVAGAVVGDGSYLPRLARAQKISSLADSYGLWSA